MAQHLLELERQRLQLEDSVAKLRKAIRHWQTWEAEYEELREETSALKEDHKTKDLEAIPRGFNGTALSQKDVQSLFVNEKNQPRSSRQVIDLLSRRIGYVQSSITSLEKLLDENVAKLSDMDSSSLRDSSGDDDLPVFEIREDLDDDGNVISSTLETPRTSAPLIEALRKSGIEELPDAPNSDVQHLPQASMAQQTKRSLSELDNDDSLGSGIPNLLGAAGTTPLDVHASSQKARSNSTMEALALPNAVEEAEDKTVSSSKASQTSTTACEQSTEVVAPRSPTRYESTVIKESSDNADDVGKPSSPVYVLPDDEGPEDAFLRRQMLQYSMNEVGAIVAEMDLEDVGSDGEYSNEDNDISSFEENEDGFGRSTGPLINEQYRREMEALQRRLYTEDKDHVIHKPQTAQAQAIAKPMEPNNSISHEERAADSKAKVSSKSVRFAEDLEVPSSSDRESQREPSTVNAEAKSLPLAEDVVERNVPLENVAQRTDSSSIHSSNRKLSLASEDTNSAIGPELTTKYHELRNRMVQRSGGFSQVDNGGADDEAAVPGQKMSKFKAARLARLGKYD